MDLGFVAGLLDDLNFTLKVTSAISLGSRCSGEYPAIWLTWTSRLSTVARHARFGISSSTCLIGAVEVTLLAEVHLGEPINPATNGLPDGDTAQRFPNLRRDQRQHHILSASVIASDLIVGDINHCAAQAFMQTGDFDTHLRN